MGWLVGSWVVLPLRRSGAISRVIASSCAHTHTHTPQTDIDRTLHGKVMGLSLTLCAVDLAAENKLASVTQPERLGIGRCSAAG